ncbi:translocation/assembly module TamB domain-containing protein [Neisseria iguanae]|uniref:Translocation/assembly module TamB n=1 Tax=Neisseria iguanae TaxID=90242 RepID=A0A2P7TYM7_9NEIS|nr:translocation/assembly module TamB domain-containing protein [Neisseria iguanae]PSJ79832.1 translocation/assembly module TamB [Neisseria iguanae]
MTTEQAPSAAVDTPPPSFETPPKHKCRWLRVLSCLGLCVLLCLFGLAGWITGTESGLRFGLYKIPSWFGVNISSKTLQGTLIDGMRGDEWLIETKGADIKISKVTLQWVPSELIRPSLHIKELILGDIAIVTKPTPPKEDRPSDNLPDSIDLPVTVFIDRAETGKITVGKSFDEQTIYIEKLKAAYRYDRKEHRLDLTEAKSPWSESAGAAVVSLQSPFSLNTAIYTKGKLEGETIHGTTRFWGSLKDVNTQILLDGENVHLHAHSILHPFAGQLNDSVGEVHVKGININPVAFLPSLPKADLTFDAILVPSFTDGVALDGALDLANAQASFADNNGIPVRTAVAEFTVDEQGVVKINEAVFDLLQQGRLKAAGSIDTVKQQLDLAVGVENVAAADAVQQNIAGRLNGKINVKGETASPDIHWSLASGFARTTGLLSILTDKLQGQRTIKLSDVEITPQDSGKLTVGGELQLFKNQLFNLDIVSKNFNPAKLDKQLPAGNINGMVALTGELDNQKFGGKMQFGPSMLNGVSLSGNADILYENQHLPRALTDIKLGTNVINTRGSFGKKGDRLNLNISAPDLSRFGFGLSGLLNAKGDLAGDLSDGIKTLETDLAGQARALRVGDLLNVHHLDFKLKGSPDVAKPLAVEVAGNRIVFTGETPAMIDAVNLTVNGTGLNHRIRGGGNMILENKQYKLDIDANGGLNQALDQWKGMVNVFDISGMFNLKLQNRMNLEAGTERVVMSPARWAVMGGTLNLQSFVWDKQAGITTKGSAQNLHMAELHNFYQPPVSHNLVLGGDWDMSYSENARGYFNIVRQGGDVILPQNNQPLGLSTLSLRTRFQNNRIDARLDGNSRFGRVDADIGINQQFGGTLANAPLTGHMNANIADLAALRPLLPPSAQNLSGSFSGSANLGSRVATPSIVSNLKLDTNYGHSDGTINIGQGNSFDTSPLSGRINLNVADLEVFRNFIPVGQTIKGRLISSVNLGGSVGNPLFNGTLNGNNLYYRNQAQGLILDNGVLRSRLQGRHWVIDSLKFHRGGTVELKGRVELEDMNPDVDVDIMFNKYRTLSRPNRRLALSGNAKVLYNVQRGVSLVGALKADFGQFGFQDSSMPNLDDDVVVSGDPPKEQAATTPIFMDLDLDLNDSVHFVGEGLNVTLGGTLKLTSRPGETIQGIGAVKVIQGRYKAYGQDLDITKGTISFVGPLDNPNLNIRAERRLSPVGAGVEVLGNLSNPRITLVANQAMSEKDKLSWLILNRASSGSDSDEAVLAAAAGAFLAGQLNDRLGLVDDFGMTSRRSRNAQTGELNPAEQVLTVGKQLSQQLYLGYEYGLTSANQSVKLVYQLTRAIQAIARVGSKSSGGELKYTIRFDRWLKSGKKTEQENLEKEQQP